MRKSVRRWVVTADINHDIRFHNLDYNVGGQWLREVYPFIHELWITDGKIDTTDDIFFTCHPLRYRVEDKCRVNADNQYPLHNTIQPNEI